MKEKLIENIDIENMVKELVQNRNKVLNEFAKAYLAETDTLPSEVELVEKRMPEKDGIIETIYYFRRKDGQQDG